MTFSGGLGPIRSDQERAAAILGRAPGEMLTHSDVLFVDSFLANYDHVKSKIEQLGSVLFFSLSTSFFFFFSFFFSL